MSQKAQSQKARAGPRDLGKMTMARQSSGHLPLFLNLLHCCKHLPHPLLPSLLCHSESTCCRLLNLIHLEEGKHPKKMPLGASFRRRLEPLPHLHNNYCRVAKVRNEPSSREPCAQLVLGKLPEGLRRDNGHGGKTRRVSMWDRQQWFDKRQTD